MTQGDNPRFRATNIPHKFIHIETRTEVDIVPFGPIGQPNQEIQWSDGNQMSILGLEEALSSAEVKKIDDGIDLLVVNLPAFVGLKLIAWKDRKAKKDLQDINFILQKYEDDERIFEELSDALANGQIEFESAPAFLLGLDIRNIFGDDTLKQLDEILSQILKNRNTIFPQLVPQTLNTEEWDAILEKTIRLFQALQRGIKP